MHLQASFESQFDRLLKKRKSDALNTLFDNCTTDAFKRAEDSKLHDLRALKKAFEIVKEIFEEIEKENKEVRN
mgnify:CR=1 FL=1